MPLKKAKRPPSRHDPHLTAKLPEEMMRALDRLAHDVGVTRSEIVRRLIEQALAVQPRNVTKR